MIANLLIKCWKKYSGTVLHGGRKLWTIYRKCVAVSCLLWENYIHQNSTIIYLPCRYTHKKLNVLCKLQQICVGEYHSCPDGLFIFSGLVFLLPWGKKGTSHRDCFSLSNAINISFRSAYLGSTLKTCRNDIVLNLKLGLLR